ncbi:hypothetical protein [Flaviaesturariibacter terrae]
MTNNKTACTQVFQTAQGPIQNSYRCGRRRLSSSTLWHIRKMQRRSATILPDLRS